MLASPDIGCGGLGNTAGKVGVRSLLHGVGFDKGKTGDKLLPLFLLMECVDKQWVLYMASLERSPGAVTSSGSVTHTTFLDSLHLSHLCLPGVAVKR